MIFSDQTKLLAAVLTIGVLLSVMGIYAIVTTPVAEPDYDSYFIKGYEFGYLSGSRDCFEAVEETGWAQTWGQE